MTKKKDTEGEIGARQLGMWDEFDNTPFECILPAASDKSSKYPTLLTIVPLFAAGERENYDTDQNKGRIYPLQKGRIRRIGPGLDVYDEDTLIAILQLGAEKKVVGPREAMPVALPPVGNSAEHRETTVYKGSLTAGMINSFLARGGGGADMERTRESVQRLANQRLWFENMDEVDGMEGVTDFFKYTGRTDCKGELLIQISPEMVNILQSYQVIDMTIRRELNDSAKAVHRFLTPQPREFSISLENLAEAICYDAGGAALKRSLAGRKATGRSRGRPNQLELMIKLGFLEEAHISGTGRKTPFVLRVVKSPEREQLDYKNDNRLTNGQTMDV